MQINIQYTFHLHAGYEFIYQFYCCHFSITITNLYRWCGALILRLPVPVSSSIGILFQYISTIGLFKSISLRLPFVPITQSPPTRQSFTAKNSFYRKIILRIYYLTVLQKKVRPLAYIQTPGQSDLRKTGNG